MKSNKSLLVSTLVIVVAVFAIAAYIYKNHKENKSKEKLRTHIELLLGSNRPMIGPKDALVTIVEFMDPECEVCSAFHPVVKTVIDQFPGKVRLIIRYMPLHTNSMYAATILEVLRTHGKFWDGLELFFKNQPNWAGHHNPRPELLMGYVAELGLEPSKIEESLKDSIYSESVKKDHSDGILLGVTRTPTFFVNGNQLVSLNYEALRNAVQTALEGASE